MRDTAVKTKIKGSRFIVMVFLFVIALTLPSAAVSPATTSIGTNEIPYESYTYWEDYGSSQKTPVYCKPMYSVKTVINPSTLGTQLFGELTDMCTDQNGNIYILDGGSSKIYITDSAYRLLKYMENFSYHGKEISFEGASGIFAKQDRIYVADTKNSRVLVMDSKGVVLSILGVPESHLIPSDFSFKPLKVAVDSKEYTYIVCDGSYYGALVYSPSLEFVGFYGANTVQATPLDIIRKLIDRLFSNDIKKGASMLSLPYQFVDMVVGPDDFVYTATGRQSEGRIMTGQVAVMNPGGKNIIRKKNYNFADTRIGVYKNYYQTQSIVGIDVDKDGFFYIVDAVSGRVFWYDRDCNLLSVFGGSLGVGEQKGTSNVAKAVVLNGTDVLVCDGGKGQISVYAITEYGQLVREAQMKTLEDDYENSLAIWNEVVKQDQNNQIAYRGLAKAYYALKDNKSAAKYAKLGVDRATYSRAYEKIRMEFLEKWFLLIFLGVLAIVSLMVVWIQVKLKKKIILINNKRLKLLFNSISHPAESFQLLKEKQLGSMVIALVLLAVYYLLSAITDRAEGFAFNYFNASTYNSFYVLLRTVGLVILWSVSNWMVCVLLGGIGKLKEIFIVTCYSLLPVIIASGVRLVLTYVLTPDEFAFVEIFYTVCVLYSLFMLIVGIIKLHDFEFGRFIGTTVLTVLSMMVILFLGFLIILLAQQVFGWVMTLFVEAKYR